jgi:hypothetical protein
MYVLTVVLKPRAKYDICDECGRAHKPIIINDYIWHMGCISK